MATTLPSKFSPLVSLIKNEIDSLREDENEAFYIISSGHDWETRCVIRHDGAMLSSIPGLSGVRHLDDLANPLLPEKDAKELFGSLLSSMCKVKLNKVDEGELQDLLSCLSYDQERLMRHVADDVENKVLSFDIFFDLALSYDPNARVWEEGVSPKDVLNNPHSLGKVSLLHDIFSSHLEHKKDGSYAWVTHTLLKKDDTVEAWGHLNGPVVGSFDDNICWLSPGIDFAKPETLTPTTSKAKA